MKRPFQILLIASFIPLCWLSFMIVHEFGHVVSAWLSGASVSRIVLHPIQISWTTFATNPHPQLVAWGGPILGSLFPLALLAGAHVLRLPGYYLFRFFAGFCLIANGLYLLVDAFARGGDGSTLLRHGTSQWQLFVFAALATPIGFCLWHGLGHHFGLGAAQGAVSRQAAITSACLLALVIATELAFYRIRCQYHRAYRGLRRHF